MTLGHQLAILHVHGNCALNFSSFLRARHLDVRMCSLPARGGKIPPSSRRAADRAVTVQSSAEPLKMHASTTPKGGERQTNEGALAGKRGPTITQPAKNLEGLYAFRAVACKGLARCALPAAPRAWGAGAGGATCACVCVHTLVSEFCSRHLRPCHCRASRRRYRCVRLCLRR